MKKSKPNPDDPWRAWLRASRKAFRDMTGPVEIGEELTDWLTRHRPKTLKAIEMINQTLWERKNAHNIQNQFYAELETLAITPRDELSLKSFDRLNALADQMHTQVGRTKLNARIFEREE